MIIDKASLPLHSTQQIMTVSAVLTGDVKVLNVGVSAKNDDS